MNDNIIKEKFVSNKEYNEIYEKEFKENKKKFLKKSEKKASGWFFAVPITIFLIPILFIIAHMAGTLEKIENSQKERVYQEIQVDEKEIPENIKKLTESIKDKIIKK